MELIHLELVRRHQGERRASAKRERDLRRVQIAARASRRSERAVVRAQVARARLA